MYTVLFIQCLVSSRNHSTFNGDVERNGFYVFFGEREGGGLVEMIKKYLTVNSVW